MNTDQIAAQAVKRLSELKVYGYGDKVGEKLLAFLPDSQAGEQVKAIIKAAIEKATELVSELPAQASEDDEFGGIDPETTRKIRESWQETKERGTIPPV